MCGDSDYQKKKWKVLIKIVGGIKMPNWCNNSLEVNGPAAELERLKKLVQGEDTALDFNKVIPYPKDWATADKAHHQVEKDRDAEAKKQGYTSFYDMPNKKRELVAKQLPDVPDGYNHGGYDWCHKNWGTKWNVDADIQGETKEGVIYFGFDSAWAPPEPVVKKLGTLFPKLNFLLKYSEPGMCFEGVLEIKKGKIIRDECNDMKTYKCNKCGETQQIEADDDEAYCCTCEDYGDWEEVKVKVK